MKFNITKQYSLCSYDTHRNRLYLLKEISNKHSNDFNDQCVSILLKPRLRNWNQRSIRTHQSEELN